MAGSEDDCGTKGDNACEAKPGAALSTQWTLGTQRISFVERSTRQLASACKRARFLSTLVVFGQVL